LSELDYAGWIAENTKATRIRLNEHLPFRWEDLTTTECHFISNRVFRNQKIERRLMEVHDKRMVVETDILVETPQGARAFRKRRSTSV
jgi:hypothetical protein